LLAAKVTKHVDKFLTFLNFFFRY